MKTKIKEYVDRMLKSAPNCPESADLKEEILSNAYERYDDLTAKGKSDEEAYELTILGIGDITPLIEKIKYNHVEKEPNSEDISDTPSVSREPTEKEQKQIDEYYVKRGIMSTVSIMLYMICWLPLVILSEFNIFGTAAEIVGLSLLMLFVCVATALMILKDVIAPRIVRENRKNNPENDSEKSKKEKKSPLHSLIDNIMWAAIVALYIIISFASGKWAVTWIIFIIGGALDNVLDAIFEYKEDKQ